MIGTIKVDVYDDTLILSYGSDYRDLARKSQRLIHPNLKDAVKEAYTTILPNETGTRGLYLHNGGLRVIHISDIETNPLKLIGTLSHEILHYVHETLQYHGVIYSAESEEAYAYLTGYITEQALMLLQKWGVLTLT